MTTPRLARKSAVAPMPVSTPPARNSARLGGAVHADATRTTRPRRISGIPAESWRRAGQLAVAVCTRMPAPNVRKSAAPVSAGEGCAAGGGGGGVPERAREEAAGESREEPPARERQGDAGGRREELRPAP